MTGNQPLDSYLHLGICMEKDSLRLMGQHRKEDYGLMLIN